MSPELEQMTAHRDRLAAALGKIRYMAAIPQASPTMALRQVATIATDVLSVDPAALDADTAPQQAGTFGSSVHERMHKAVQLAKGIPAEASGAADGVREERQALIAIGEAQAMVRALCLRRGEEGARDWTMSIPARPYYDPDLVIGGALRLAKDAILARFNVSEKEAK
jgi:hypothetical protein